MIVELNVECLGGRRYVVRTGQRFEIGRAGVSVLVPESSVSRRHAVIELSADGKLYLADLNSRNGTWLNDARLDPYVPALVQPGSTIVIAQTVLQVVFKQDDEDTRRVTERELQEVEPLVSDDIRILGAIGAGANGRVYAAYQELMDRRVAVKFLHPRPGDSDGTLERFLQEGRLACRVRSPHVVEVYDFRVEKNRIYMIMELVNGITLRDRLLLDPPVAIPEALLIAEEVARGLAAVHLEGVIHRDIKPSNILLAPDGIAKLSDFGIAKDLSSDHSLTPEKTGFGSLPYVAPEQAAGASLVDARADVFALGATLYYMLTGSPPYKGDREQLITKERPPAPVTSLNASCPADVERLVDAMLQGRPDARPSTAVSVARQLEELRRLHFPTYTPKIDQKRRAHKQTGRNIVSAEMLRMLQESESERSPTGDESPVSTGVI